VPGPAAICPALEILRYPVTVMRYDSIITATGFNRLGRPMEKVDL
jgi:hypothetical protein